MSNNQKELADALYEETMAEMAETFFGARRKVDRLLEAVDEAAEELDALRPSVIAPARRLHALLLDDDTVRDFYAALGVDPEPFLRSIPRRSELSQFNGFKRVAALTRKGRYLRLVLHYYKALQAALDNYLHGIYVEDSSRPGRKKLTPNLAQLDKLAERTNEAVERVNTAESPSQVLGYVHTLDPGQVEREEVTGGNLERYSGSMDKELAFTPVDLEEYGLLRLPELPPASRVERSIKDFASRLHDRRKDEVQQLFRFIRHDKP